MEQSNRKNLFLAAFRIYLAYWAQETDDQLRDYKWRLRISSCSEDGPKWEEVVKAGSRVVKYIHNFCHDDQVGAFFARGAHGLCAIEAAQDALYETLRNASPVAGRTTSEFLRLASEHTWRAQFMSNAIVSMIRQNSELSALWELAAQKVLDRTQQAAFEGIIKTSLETDTSAMHHVARAVKLSNLAATEKNAEIAELQLLSACYHRLFAAHAAAGHETSYDVAASSCETAIDYARQAGKCMPGTAKLWCKAAATMRQAAVMIAAEKAENPKNQPISEAKRFANELVSCVILTETNLNELDFVGDVPEPQVPCVLQVWNLLESIRDKAKQLCEEYVESVIARESPTIADSLLKQFSASVTDFKVVSSILDNMQRHVDSVEYYRYQARCSGYSSNIHIRSLRQQCWSSAAAHTDQLFQLGAQIVANGAYQAPTRETQRQQKENSTKAQMYVLCAEQMIHQATLYFNCARAEPRLRVTECWSAAAECQIQAVVAYMRDISAACLPFRKDDALPAVSAEVKTLLHQAQAYVKAVDYLQRSARFVPLPSHSELTARVPVLWDNSAEFLIERHRNNDPLLKTLLSAEKLCTALANRLINQQASAKEVDRVEKACVYARKYASVLPTCNITAGMWKVAFDACGEGCQWHLPPIKKCPASIECITLHAQSAELYAQGNAYASVVLSVAAKILRSVQSRYKEGQREYAYHVSVVQRVCTMFVDAELIPEEVLQLPGGVVNTEQEQILQRTVIACEHEIDCAYELLLVHKQSPFAKLWESAELEARNLRYCYDQKAFQSYAELSDYVVDIERQTIAERISFQEKFVRCRIASARTSLPVWEAAVKMCFEVKDEISWGEEPIQAVDYHIAAAEAVVGGDEELTSLRIEAAAAARALFLAVRNHLPHKTGGLRKELRAVDLRVTALLARRQGPTEAPAIVELPPPASLPGRQPAVAPRAPSRKLRTESKTTSEKHDRVCTIQKARWR